jgi:hypothetical protein
MLLITHYSSLAIARPIFLATKGYIPTMPSHIQNYGIHSLYLL